MPFGVMSRVDQGSIRYIDEGPRQTWTWVGLTHGLGWVWFDFSVLFKMQLSGREELARYKAL